ncbi:right-handed parallel beta-helix repeat-containing protein [Intrasporangium calvum]|uniref:Right-handed parallel beta-helix repeat-containing protein n=1 Tax=Intrasporangium calvum TaxID=53358 RepID=A0ABT5GMJ0_9MICO|nr:right-handed parallel beta-helix repeat-containing protein [Intrasporangium calvum]MDC5698881.1 right-handed parallel beta-helix repeat-containing protein [Intrasporangium calvum]
MRRTVLLAVAAAGSLLAVPLPGQAREVTTHVVDDDRAQCAQAGYTSIGAAVAAAAPGDLVLVCGGSYEERVVVDKTLVIKGQPDEVEALDCFAETPSALGDLDTNVFPVLSPPDAVPGPLLALQADGIDVSGLVLEGMVDAGVNSIYRAALETSPAHSGFRVHHTMFRLNTLGMETTSNGAIPSRFDHNCLRQNGWGAANQRFTLTQARFDHNESFRQRFFDYEMGWSVARVDAVLLDHNIARQAAFHGVYVGQSSSIRIEDNSLSATRLNIWVVGPTENITIARNTLSSATVGIRLGPGVLSPTEAIVDAVVEGNTISGTNVSPGTGIWVPLAYSGHGLRVVDNILSDHHFAGLRVHAGSGNTYADNVMERNGSFGTFVGPGATGNTFANNIMLGNQVDAQDNTAYVEDGVTKVRNTWTGNLCVTDVPMGVLCDRGLAP